MNGKLYNISNREIIKDNKDDIESLDHNIQTNLQLILSNENKINTLQDDVNENTTKISENTTKISENTTKISENTEKIDNILSEKTYLYDNTENTGSVVDISEGVFNFKFISLVIYDNVNNKRNVGMFPTSELEPNDTFEMNGLTITYLNPTSLQLSTATDFHIIKVVGEIRTSGNE